MMWSTQLPFRPPRPRPFFDLPWDIREQIYSYIELDALPPLSNGTEYAGFVLSCKLAAEELSHVATVNYRKYLDYFERLSRKMLGYKIKVAQPEQASAVKNHPFAHLTRLKVEVQLKSCAVLSDDELDTTPWCDTFHPLFGLFLESLQIHFIAPTLPNMRIYRSDVSNMYEIVSRVFDVIEIMNSQVRDPERPTFFGGRPDRHERKVTRFLKAFEKQVCGFTRTKRVSVKAICFSWDCRKTTRIGSPANMMGPVWSHNLRLRDFPGEDKQTYFRVHDVKGYAGEMWIASSRRWAPTSVSLPWLLYNRTSKIVLLQMKNLDFGEAAQILSKVEI